MSVNPVKPRTYIVGLTGGIATGKSTAAEYFKLKHIPIIDSDKIVKQLWDKKEEMIEKAEALFGFPIRTKADRKRVAETIFSDEAKRKQLNEIVHPFVFEEIENQKRVMENFPFVVIDMPLLIESGYAEKVDHVCLVYTNKELQIKRLSARDELSLSDAILRIDSQMAIEEKRSHAHTILNNEKDVEYLYREIDHFIGELKREKFESI